MLDMEIYGEFNPYCVISMDQITETIVQKILEVERFTQEELNLLYIAPSPYQVRGYRKLRIFPLKNQERWLCCGRLPQKG